MMVIPFLLAGLIGAVLVTLGAGGSIVTLPVLVYAAGLDTHQAVGTSLVVVGSVALAGTLMRRESVVVKTGLLFGGTGMLGTFPGVWLNHQVSGPVVLLGFAATMLVVAALMFRTKSPAGERRRCSFGKAGAVGLGVGVATGFFGVGGGFLIVPALTLLVNLGMTEAVATSLLVITLNCIGGLVGHGSYGAVDWSLGLTFAAAALFGAGVALPLAKHVRATTLERVFATLVAVVGAAMAIDGVRQVFS